MHTAAVQPCEHEIVRPREQHPPEVLPEQVLLGDAHDEDRNCPERLGELGDHVGVHEPLFVLDLNCGEVHRAAAHGNQAGKDLVEHPRCQPILR